MKTNTQHTPGPWHLRGDTVLVTSSLQIAQADRGNKHPDTAQANARLIASAPALLKALKAVCAFSVIPKLSDDSLSRMACGDALTARDDTARIGYINTPFRDNAHALKQAIEQARAAIAQAEGRGV